MSRPNSGGPLTEKDIAELKTRLPLNEVNYRVSLASQETPAVVSKADDKGDQKPASAKK